MRIVLTTNDTALTFMRRAGYGYQKEGSGEIAFVRRVGSGPFPRYHAYVTEAADGRGETSKRSLQLAAGSLQLVINLHVDQKAPTYQRGRAHSGEYDGQLVEQEAARLRALAPVSRNQWAGDNDEQSPRGGSSSDGKGFWRRLFG